MALVTKEDYLNYMGVDLDIELASSVLNDLGDENASSRFITQVEEWCLDYLQLNYAFDGVVKDTQVERFKKGVMWQCAYILEETDFTNSSGLIASTGTFISQSQLDKVKMSPRAKEQFKLCGMCNWRSY